MEDTPGELRKQGRKGKRIQVRVEWAQGCAEKQFLPSEGRSLRAAHPGGPSTRHRRASFFSYVFFAQGQNIVANISCTVPSATPLGGYRVTTLETILTPAQSLKLAQIHAGLSASGALMADGSGAAVEQEKVVNYLLEQLV